jgi:hypothetical protein
MLKQDVFPLNVTKIAQALTESVDERPGSAGIANPDTKPIRATFFGCCASTGKLSAKSMANEFFTHRSSNPKSAI